MVLEFDVMHAIANEMLKDTRWYPPTQRNPAAPVLAKKTVAFSNSRAVRIHPPIRPCLFWHSLLARRALLRAQILRSSAKFSPLPPSYYNSHTDELVAAFTAGEYLKFDPSKPVEVDEEGNRIAPIPGNMLSDPAAMEGMMGGMKNQMVMMVPQMVIMGWINFFFQGFVLSTWTLYHRIPFQLTTFYS